MNDTPPIPAPVDAIAWTADAGYLFDPEEVARHVAAGDVVLVVSGDGMFRGVTAADGAPLRALLRVEGDLVDVIGRLEDVGGVIARLAARVAETDTVAAHARLAARVSDLGDHVTSVVDGVAVEVAALKGRVRQLENRRGL